MSARAAMTFWPASPSIRSSARLPRSNRLSSASKWDCVIVLHPLFHAGVSGDLGVEDEKTVLQFAKMRAYTHALLFQQRATFRFRPGAAVPKGGIAQHFPDRHSRRLHSVEKFDPDQN